MKADIQLCTQREEKEMLAMIAHDLRAPMCCVSGAAQIALAQAKQGKAVEEQLRQILQAVTAMDRVLSGLCDERARGVSPERLERALRGVVAPRAAAKYQRMMIDLSVLYGRELPFSFDALYRVLSNLLINAVKYTGEGGEIALRAAITHGGMDEAAVFTVSDSGMGMKAEFMHRMYEPSARAEESAFLPGRGLGLAIVRRLVLEMGGKIDVKSEWGRGTAFSVCLPLGSYAVCQ